MSDKPEAILHRWRRHGSAGATEEEIATLLSCPPQGGLFFQLLAASDARSRTCFGSRGYVFAQIGLNAEPCSKNCAFCSMGGSHYSMDERWKKDIPQMNREILLLLEQGIDDLFLMTTADFPQDEVLRYFEAARAILPDTVRLVANIGDLDRHTARHLRDCGCNGAYHIRRLREGRDTGIPPEDREATLAALNDAGLDIYYCLEPIGPEHDPAELARELIFARSLHPQAMAAMRRVPVPGTPLAGQGRISALELTKIVAVTNLVVEPSRCMNVHEPMQMPLLAGVNQLYAESGANPRDTQSRTEEGRGFTPAAAWELLAEGGWFPPAASPSVEER